MNSKNKWKVLISAPYFQPVVDVYAPLFEEHGIEIVVPEVQERMSEEELLGCIADIDGAICGDDRFTDRVLACAPRLKVISKWGTGIDSIDRESAARRGIAVKNTPNAFTDAVSDLTMGFILAFARQIPWANEDIRAGVWKKRLGVSLGECTIGLVGLGNIGRAVARRAAGFGMRILGYDATTLPSEVLAGTGIKVVSFEQVLRESDFVGLHCDLNPGSKYLIRDAQFDLMKSNAVIVNTARGPLIEEAALVRALESKKIAGAALDVFEQEPLPAESRLREFKNVLFSPHNANSSPSAWKRVHENTLNNLVEELKKYL
ncbi:MAG: phosphoglycerate dehydrogenase [bacterium]|nr:phosphoglycerate dehydrogenase [bacterium]